MKMMVSIQKVVKNDRQVWQQQSNVGIVLTYFNNNDIDLGCTIVLPHLANILPNVGPNKNYINFVVLPLYVNKIIPLNNFDKNWCPLHHK
jgi:hypothetical protein